MARAFIGIGSNLNPAENVRKAVRELARRSQLRAISTVYLTEPIDRPDQPQYYNLVAEIETGLSPIDLKRNLLLPIEQDLGRSRDSDKFSPRTIDLDLILYDDLVLKDADLELPDPEIAVRPFLVKPLQELAPDLVVPGINRTIAELAEGVSQDCMKSLNDYTELLRKEIKQR